MCEKVLLSMMIRETILICLVISEGLWAREVIVVSGTDNYGKANEKREN